MSYNIYNKEQNKLEQVAGDFNTSTAERLQGEIDELKDKIIFQPVSFGKTQSVAVGNFSLDFTITKSGYNALGVVGWTLGDRSLASKLHISSISINNNNSASIMGYCSSAVTVPTNANMIILYSKN